MSLCPAQYKAAAGVCLKEFKNNVTSYTLGVGRKFSDHWSGAFTYGREASNDDKVSALAPTSGYNKMGLGVTYTGEQAVVTLGMQKINNGNVAKTSAVAFDMSNNTTLVTALKVGFKF